MDGQRSGNVMDFADSSLTVNGKGITNTRGTKREDPHSDFCPTKIRSFASLRSQDNYAAESNANERDLENIFEEY